MLQSCWKSYNDGGQHNRRVYELKIIFAFEFMVCLGDLSSSFFFISTSLDSINYFIKLTEFFSFALLCRAIWKGLWQMCLQGIFQLQKKERKKNKVFKMKNIFEITQRISKNWRIVLCIQIYKCWRCSHITNECFDLVDVCFIHIHAAIFRFLILLSSTATFKLFSIYSNSCAQTDDLLIHFFSLNVSFHRKLQLSNAVSQR